jgi:enoyl-CoA hydratase/carnithine racemase
VEYEQILFDVDGAVATITLNRPQRMNAWTKQMSNEMVHAIEGCNDNPEIGAIIITGEGRGFCAGADIEQGFKAQLDGADTSSEGPPATNWVKLVRESKPIIAAVNGASVGVGATLILPADVIIASDQAKFAMAFVRMGLVPELASSHFLVQRLGFGPASEMCLTGRLYSASEAHDMGLVDRLVPHAELMSTAREMAELMAANPSTQARWIKQLLSANGSETDLDAVVAREGRMLAKAFATPEHKEAVNAFLEKRPPDFEAAASAGNKADK